MTTSRRAFLALIFVAIATAVSAASELTTAEKTQGFRNGRVLVKLKEEAMSTRSAERQTAENEAGIQSRRSFEHLPRQQVLEFESARSVASTIKALRATGLYEYVEADRILQKRTTPNDPYFTQQWALNNTGQSSGTSGADIGAVAAWSVLNNASGVIVAVMDSGIRLTHADLVANLWTNNSTGTSGYLSDLHGINTIVSNTTTSSGSPADDEGHGTHVSGIIGAVGNNGVGISGVAWSTQIMALKFLDSTGSGTTANAIECINYAIAKGAAIINGSYGSSTYSSSEYSAIKAARAAGIIFVAAAGNDALNTDNGNDYPAGYLLDNIVTVAATTRTDALASFSNYGPGSVDIAAPGDSIYSTYNTSDTSYSTLSGTSMATPQVTGSLALLKAKFPTETYRQLINRLLRSTTKLSVLSGKVQSGGRLNLYAALTSTSNKPMNDDFSSAATLSGTNIRVRSSNVGASGETGEPSHASVTGGASLWWSWTPTVSANVTIDTTGSDYDTLLGIYTGSSVSALTAVGSNDNASSSLTTSSVTFTTTANTTYWIAVDGKSGASGATILRISTVPGNDNFANAQTVTGDSFSVSGFTSNASRETGESKIASVGAGHSVWYKWVAPTSGRHQLSAYSAEIDMVAGVYTGSSVSALTAVASNDDSISYNSNSLVTFTATAGTTYYFGIDNYDTDGGDFTLSLVDSLWQYVAEAEVTSSPAVATDGTVYFGSNDYYVYAVNSDGSLKWERATGDSVDMGSPAVGSDGTVYIGSNDGYFYALNGSTGVPKWRYAAGSAIYAAPAIATDGTVYFRDDTLLYSLTANGTKNWSYTISGSTYSSPAIATDGTLYIGATGGSFYALNADGTLKWSYTANDDIYTSPAIATDGTVYFATLSGTVYALSSSGTLKWTWSVSDGSSITSAIAIAADGTLYFGGYDGKLHALSSSGTEKWSYGIGSEIRASSPAIAADGTVYIGAYDGKLYAINADGTLKRSYATSLRVRSSPVIANGRVYIGSNDYKLYAFSIGYNGLSSAWPMLQQGQLHAARATTSASLVTISTQPQATSVASGSSFTLSVTATGNGTLSYQWYLDGTAISGATGSSYTVSSASSSSAGTYTVVVSSGLTSVLSSSAVVSIGGTATAGRLTNLSARAGVVGNGSQALIVGFVLSGGSKPVLLRGIGPGLSALGLTSGLLTDPQIKLYNSSGSLLADNDDWNGVTTLSTAFSSTGAFSLSSSSRDAAMLTSLGTSGSYTVILTDTSGGSGIALGEIYDTETSSSARLTNLSARAQVGTGDSVLIGGFVISGNVSKQVLIRAVGPSLSTLGLTSGLLADPQLKLYNSSGTLVKENDDWGDTTTLTSAFSSVGAFSLNSGSKDSAMLVTLAPGAYTAMVSGASSTTGIALVEIYEMP